MSRYSLLAASSRRHRTRLYGRVHSTRRFVLSPVIQHSKLGAYGGLGDFVSQTSALFPCIEWALPLTERIRASVGAALGSPLAGIPVDLFDPVTGDVYCFLFDVYAHTQPNGSRAWLFHNKELMGSNAAYATILAANRLAGQRNLGSLPRFHSLRINQNSYSCPVWPEPPPTVANTPLLGTLHPLVRRYITRPEELNAVVLSAMAKAVVRFIVESGIRYDVLWAQDWHFGALAGEILEPEHRTLAEAIYYVQHLHNALHQGICTPDLLDVLGWPAGHVSRSLYRWFGNANLLAGALTALQQDRLKGKAVAVSPTHAAELATVERGAGLHQLFRDLKTQSVLVGLNNPIAITDRLIITDHSQLETTKPDLKAAAQAYFGLPRRPEAFLLLWSHRFTQQKQPSAVLRALELLLEDGNTGLQVAFFCDTDQGVHPQDVSTLQGLIDRFPENIAHRHFAPSEEMAIAAGADGALMASYFEPFGYAPIWAAIQGGFVVTGANGGQLDLFAPATTFFIDIWPDIDKPKPFLRSSLSAMMKSLFFTNAFYRRQVFQHNTNSIAQAMLRAKAAFDDTETRRVVRRTSMRNMIALARRDDFSHGLRRLLFGDVGEPQEAGSRTARVPRWHGSEPAPIRWHRASGTLRNSSDARRRRASEAFRVGV